MRIGAGLDARLGLPFDELRDAGRRPPGWASKASGRPQEGFRTPFTCAPLGRWTRRCAQGYPVVPAARMWSPLALAAQAATVGQLSDGRFVLGIGTGGYGPGFWASVGMPNRPVAVMRDYLTVVRALLAGETVTYDGPALRLRDASLALGGLARVPVYLGALGPQMLRLAGELADGALLNWATTARIAESRRLLHQGAGRGDATRRS